MSEPRKRSFSLSALLTFFAFAALIVSQIVMMRYFVLARAEIADVRRRFGYIRIDNEEQIYVARITETEPGEDAYRLHIPPGNHYMLHLTEAEFPTENYPVDPIPTGTMSMNGWKDGADVVLRFWIAKGIDGKPVVHVATYTEELFDFRLENWWSGGPTEASNLETNPQKTFDPDSTIRFLWRRNPKTARGVMLWMEPVADWRARKSLISNQTDPPDPSTPHADWRRDKD